MEGFNEYFITLFSVCTVCSLCDLLSDFASKGVASALKLICSLSVLLTVFSALFSSCSIDKSFESLENSINTSAISENRTEAEGMFIENTRKELEKDISRTITGKFGINPDSVSISFNTEINDGITDVSVNSVTVSFPKDTDEITLKSVKAYTDGIFGNDIVVLCKRSK